MNCLVILKKHACDPDTELVQHTVKRISKDGFRVSLHLSENVAITFNRYSVTIDRIILDDIEYKGTDAFDICNEYAILDDGEK